MWILWIFIRFSCLLHRADTQQMEVTCWVSGRKYINLFQSFTISFVSVCSGKMCQSSFGGIFWEKGEGRIKGLKVFYFQLMRVTASNCVLSHQSHNSNRRAVVFEILHFFFSRETYLVSHLLTYCSKIFLPFLFVAYIYIYITVKKKEERKITHILATSTVLGFCVHFQCLSM